MKDKTKTKIEYRDADGVTADDAGESMAIRGVAVRFGVPNCVFQDIDGTQYFETIEPGAFDGVDLSEVLLRYNHDDSVPVLANTRNGTMQIQIDEKQLALTATLADTSVGRDVYQLIKDGTVGGLSVAFIIAEDGDEYTEHARIIRKVERLVEISVVDLPAYENTLVAARNIERMQREREDKLKRLLLRTYF